MHNPRAMQQHEPKIEVLATCIGNIVRDNAATT